ncbi:MAG: helix-turn-helix transcriptional regulator [Eubacterium sp.]|nr:helix-turn-helix transcriptional regulator [Eubacterium sp.]
MNIHFDENIKRLRKERGLTQEALADELGVSFQTVSKWERGESYPDIRTLAVIAAFFDVTADELLGAHSDDKAAEIEQYLTLYEKMQWQDIGTVLAKYEKAVKTYPHEYVLLVNYMELLHLEKGSLCVQDYQPLSDKLHWAYEKIQNACTDDAVRIRAKRIMIQHLMWEYQCLGWSDDEQKIDPNRKEEAARIASTLPSISDSREYVLLEVEDSLSDWYTNRKKVMVELSYLLQNVLISYCYYDDRFTPEYKIETIQLMNGILKLSDTDDSPSKNRIHIIYNYGHLGHLYAAVGKEDQALHYLRLAAEQAVLLDTIPEAERIALFYEREEQIRKISMRERMIELMTKHYPLPAALKETPAFQAIISIMK